LRRWCGAGSRSRRGRDACQHVVNFPSLSPKSGPSEPVKPDKSQNLSFSRSLTCRHQRTRQIAHSRPSIPLREQSRHSFVRLEADLPPVIRRNEHVTELLHAARRFYCDFLLMPSDLLIARPCSRGREDCRSDSEKWRGVLRLGLRADCRCPWLYAKAQEAKRNRQLHLVNPIFLSGTSLRYRAFKAFRISCCRQLARSAF
jgi:hypothetical protein